jgi:hypothetical protein
MCRKHAEALVNTGVLKLPEIKGQLSDIGAESLAKILKKDPELSEQSRALLLHHERCSAFIPPAIVAAVLGPKTAVAKVVFGVALTGTGASTAIFIAESSKILYKHYHPDE